ncbi:hypothetical protein G7K_4478-t1 [Saitoella complicata NRRL Y-17804]|uniref:Uncharacterized protein n=1 Tax=Saitoella complicata (strain BCRC 22490 / CBS 7301 / JCM 7358 / NBRC 10748 / NRRL Y-17804) TaxID=698492 RepID=A0A0E9NKX4_SAICN|nr:hypothetical protein G7K_4478-t1 [Saitoella complicata NRRL Y-17804]
MDMGMGASRSCMGMTTDLEQWCSEPKKHIIDILNPTICRETSHGSFCLLLVLGLLGVTASGSGSTKQL